MKRKGLPFAMLPLWKAMTRTSKASLKNKAKHQQTSWQYWKVHSIHKDTAHKNIPKLYSSETTHPAWVLLANSALWLTRPKKKKKKTENLTMKQWWRQLLYGKQFVSTNHRLIIKSTSAAHEANSGCATCWGVFSTR